MHDDALPLTDPSAFWEDFYRTKRTGTSGRASSLLVRFAGDLPAGTALDLGASHGDDVLWLAGRGWQATGLDISETAIRRAVQRATDLGLSDRARFRVHDLAKGLPAGGFDLITALYFQSPVDLPRPAILRDAAGHVSPGGHILVVAHASAPPWSMAEGKDAAFPTVAEDLEAMRADPAVWSTVVADVVEREATGPDGTVARLQDTVVMLRRER